MVNKSVLGEHFWFRRGKMRVDDFLKILFLIYTLASILYLFYFKDKYDEEKVIKTIVISYEIFAIITNILLFI